MAKKNQDEWQEEGTASEIWNNQDNAWYRQAMQTAQALLDRPGFSYDPTADPLYRAARDQTVRQGRRAMEDVLGKTASLTGGYASSYAQTQASQAYDDQLTRLASLLPDYYERARAAYDRVRQGVFDLDQLRGLELPRFDRQFRRLVLFDILQGVIQSLKGG